MYNCRQCGKVSKAGQPAITKVTETREATYPYRKGAQRHYGKCPSPPPDDPDKRCKDDHGGSGTQIVTQLLICKSCDEEDKKVA